MREAAFLVEVDGEGLGVGTELTGGSAEGVTGLKRMAALHAASAVAAASDMDTESAADGFARDLGLVLFGDFRLLQVLAATVRARLGQRNFVLLVGRCGRLAVGVPAIGIAGLAARWFGVRLRGAFGEGGGLALAGPAGCFEGRLKFEDAGRCGVELAPQAAAVGALGAGGHALEIVVWPNRFLDKNLQTALDHSSRRRQNAHRCDRLGPALWRAGGGNKYKL
jgi:hypothetical protein